MRALDLDHLRVRNREGWVRYALAAAALGFGADQALYYRALSHEVAMAELRVASARQRPRSVTAVRDVSAEEVALARDTFGRLSTPWSRLFRALEAAHTGQISLLSIEPDAEAGTVAIHGEAKDYLAALTYMAGLADQPSLQRVHFVRHEIQRPGAQRPLAFTISAGWQDRK